MKSKRIGFHFFRPSFVRPSTEHCTLCKQTMLSNRHIVNKQAPRAR